MVKQSREITLYIKNVFSLAPKQFEKVHSLNIIWIIESFIIIITYKTHYMKLSDTIDPRIQSFIDARLTFNDVLLQLLIPTLIVLFLGVCVLCKSDLRSWRFFAWLCKSSLEETSSILYIFMTFLAVGGITIRIVNPESSNKLVFNAIIIELFTYVIAAGTGLYLKWLKTSQQKI